MLGCGEGVDITVEGTGVEPRHCVVENKAGVVTLTPLAQMTAVDGVPLSGSTRLTQGEFFLSLRYQACLCGVFKKISKSMDLSSIMEIRFKNNLLFCETALFTIFDNFQTDVLITCVD